MSAYFISLHLKSRGWKNASAVAEHMKILDIFHEGRRGTVRLTENPSAELILMTLLSKGKNIEDAAQFFWIKLDESAQHEEFAEIVDSQKRSLSLQRVDSFAAALNAAGMEFLSEYPA